MRNKVISAAQAAQLVRNGDMIAVGSSAGLTCPDHVLAGLGARFRAEGHPRGLTFVAPIAAGDMYGIKGIDHLAQPGLLSCVIAGSYPSGPSSLPSPLIWEMLGRNELAAYNLPSGVLFDMLREGAAHRPGVLTKVGLDTFVDPQIDGGCMNDAARTHGEVVRRVEFDGDTWLHYKPLQPQVAIIRGTTADERGNISMEHEGAVLGMVDVALAARGNGGIVICQVKRLTSAGSIPTQRVHIPSTLVDFIVVDPDQRQATGIAYDPTISGELRRSPSSFVAGEFNVDKVIARRAAMELAEDSAVNLGFGISALVPEILLEEGHGEDVTWVIEQGPVGGVPLTGFAFGCAANAQAIFPTPQQFIYFQAGAFDCSLLSFLEVDRNGSVNVSRLPGKPYLTAGAGGFIDITTRPKKVVFSGYFTAGGLKVSAADGALRIEQDGKIAKFVDHVDHVTFDGRRGAEAGTDITYVTERCVIKRRPDGLEIVEIAPGVDLERDVLGRAAIPLKVSGDLKLMDRRLFLPEPMGLTLKPNCRAEALAAALAQGGAAMSTELVANDSFVATREAPHVVLIRIVARPLGVFTIAGREALTAFLANLDKTHGARCIVLTGSGASFSAGSNIKEFEATAEWIEKARQVETRLNETIELGPVPVIAACNGHVLGGGAVMALACDMRIASRSATFGVPEVMLGAMPTATGTMRLPMLIGRGAALKLILTGEPIGADEALRLGIFDEVVDDGALMDRAMALAGRIASVSPAAVAAARRSVAAGLRQGYAAGLAMETELTVPLGLSNDAIEGKAAFVGKRPPVFR